jgi:ABC-type Na+ efflux pump permease subunit
MKYFISRLKNPFKLRLTSNLTNILYMLAQFVLFVALIILIAMASEYENANTLGSFVAILFIVLLYSFKISREL